MMTLAEIKEEVLPHLTFAEQMELAAALRALHRPPAPYDAFDAAIDEGLKPGGKLDLLRKKALAEDARGETEDWP